MAFYLQMDGVDDRVVLPSMTFTEIIMDFKVNSKSEFERYWSLPFGAEYFQVATGSVNDQFSASVTQYVNGVSQTNTSVMMETGTRAVARSVMSTKTNVISIFANGTGQIAHGDIWNIKIYNGATLQAHYDMTLGNVQDQSGNGRHATLTGGTWINDGPSSTPVSYLYDTAQQIVVNRSALYDTLQQIVVNRSTQFDTSQQIVKNVIVSMDTKQQITVNRSYLFDTRQEIGTATVKVSYLYDTKQTIVKNISLLLPTQIIIYKLIPDTIRDYTVRKNTADSRKMDWKNRDR